MKEIKAERVQKLIANAGICSRREAEQLIEAGKVRVNGKTIQLGTKALLSDAIFVNNKPLPSSQDKPITLILNKPKGFICSNKRPLCTQQPSLIYYPQTFKKTSILCRQT